MADAGTPGQDDRSPSHGPDNRAPSRSRLARAALLGAAALATLGALAFGADHWVSTAQARQIAIKPPVGAPMSFADLVARVSPAVVSVHVVTRVEAPDFSDQMLQDLPPQFRQFAPPRGQRPQEGRSAGSGFFISADGLLVTNFHVIEDAKEIKVTLKGGQELAATVVGADRPTDLAVLRVKDEKGPFEFVVLDRAPKVRVGDWVVAVGNPFDLGTTATAGIVSADGREVRNRGTGQYNDFLQIDAPINVGNSGGPTFDLAGNVVGINSQIVSPTGGSVGIGFMIPSDVAARITDRLIKDGKVVRGWVGVQIQDLSPESAEGFGLAEASGAIVNSVVEDSPAQKGGLKAGDVVLALDGKAVANATDMTRRVGDLTAGATARLDVLRDGKRQTVSIRVAERPSEEQLAGAPSMRPDAVEEKGGEALGLALAPMRSQDRQRLGLALDETGAVVMDVDPDSEAAEVGLRPGHAILAVNARPVTGPEDVAAAVAAARKEGRRNVNLRIATRQGVLTVPLPLESRRG